MGLQSLSVGFEAEWFDAKLISNFLKKTCAWRPGLKPLDALFLLARLGHLHDVCVRLHA